MTVCFIILHYQSLEETVKCIASIKRLDGQEEISILVIDNASPNGTGKNLAEQYNRDDQVFVYTNEENEGFSHANNKAYHIAKERWNPDFLVVANNDIEFEDGRFWEKVKKNYNDNQFSVLGPDIYNNNLDVHQSPLSKNPPNQVGVIKTLIFNKLALTFFPLFRPVLNAYFKRDAESENQKQWSSSQTDVCLMGACLIFSPIYLEARENIFWPETFFYYEESILTLWCRENKHLIIYAPEMRVLHESGKTTRTVNPKDRQYFKFKIRNTYKSAKIYFNYLRSGRNGRIK